MVNEYVEAQPIYQAPTYQLTVGNQMYNQGYAQPMYQQPMYQQPAFPQGNTGYQGNVGTDSTGALDFMNPGVNPQGFNQYGF